MGPLAGNVHDKGWVFMDPLHGNGHIPPLHKPHISHRQEFGTYGIRKPGLGKSSGAASFANDPGKFHNVKFVAKEYFRCLPIFFLQATQDIHLGEELFVSYGLDY